jgi:hypothetical protein
MFEDVLPFNQECQICQELINSEDDIMRCQNQDHDHIFHHECATTWIMRGSNTCPTCREILTNEPPSVYPTMNRHFSEFIDRYDYLEGRSWYVDDPNLQNLLESVVAMGLGNRINALHGDLRNHLLDLYFEANISDYYYLQERSWFVNNHKLKYLLRVLVDHDFGNLVQVTAGDFEEHLRNLIVETGGSLNNELNRDMLLRIYPNIEDMDQFRLSNYGFTSIHPDTFQNLPNSNILQSIYLNENFIEFIEPGTFHNLPNLKKINLTYNDISDIVPECYPDLPGLEVIINYY